MVLKGCFVRQDMTYMHTSTYTTGAILAFLVPCRAEPGELTMHTAHRAATIAPAWCVHFSLWFLFIQCEKPFRMEIYPISK